jgi:hypothetical protein
MNDIRSRILQFTTQPVAHETAELGTVYLRRLTLGELDKMQADSKVAAKPGDVQIPTTVRLLARFIGDETGATVFDLAKTEDRDVLLAFPVALAADILRAGNRINNMEEDKGEAKNA